MKREDVDALIARLTQTADRDPSGFTRRVALFAALGYVYIAGVLTLLVALLATMVAMVVFVPNGITLKLGILFGMASASMAWSILAALWVRQSPPEGITLRPKDAPRLFDRVRNVGAAAGSPEFHEILLVPEYNAAVVQHPRLGIFGWHRNYLLIGLPLLMSLSDAEFTAVLAHEFGHLSRSHGRLGNWLYRLRRSWLNVFERFESRPPGRMAILLTAFIRWYWPRLNARTFVLSRLQEYDADATAARVAGAGALASALTRLPVDGPYLDDVFWADLSRRANLEPEPPAGVFHSLCHALESGASSQRAAQWLRTAFLLETSNADTHPCLKDRLRALGHLPEGIARAEFPTSAPERHGPVAGRILLEDRYDDLCARMDADWRKAISAGWKERHEDSRRARDELARLEAESRTRPANVEDLWRQATLHLQLEGDAAALPILDRILAIDPGHAPSRFIRGRHLLEVDDPAGVDLVEDAIARDFQLTEPGCQLLYAHFARTGQRTRRRSVEERLDHFEEERNAAQQERNNITAKDRFLPHGLPPEQVAAVAMAASAEPEVRTARLVQKEVRHFPQSRCYVLALDISRPFWKPTASDANQKLVHRVLDRMQFSELLLALVTEGEMKPVGRKIRAVEGSVILAR